MQIVCYCRRLLCAQFHTFSSHHLDQVVLALIEANANLEHQNPKKVTALNMACENAHEECAVLLLKAGSRSADIADAWGDTPRSIAEKKGLKKVLALM